MEKQKEKICEPYANRASQQLGRASGNGFFICGGLGHDTGTDDDQQTGDCRGEKCSADATRKISNSNLLKLQCWADNGRNCNMYESAGQYGENKNPKGKINFKTGIGGEELTDERFEQLMKQALKPEIDGRDVVIQKNTNNYKNRMKRKRRLRVCITAGIAAAACVVAGVQLNRFGNGQVPYTETKQDFVTNKTSSAFSLCVYASELSSENSVALNNENGNSWVFGMRSDSDMLSYCIAFPVSCKGEQIKQITYTINKGAFQIIGENPEKFCTQMTLYTEQTMNLPRISQNKDQQESVLYCTSYTIDYENQDAGCFVNICGFTADDEQTENLFFKSESIEAGKWTEKLNSILFDKIQVTVCVAFEDGTSKTQTIAIAAAASDANSTYEKGQTQKEKLIQYEMR